MPTSLAAQLAQAVSLNAPLLNESARKKHRATSYLFSSSSAQTEDIESIHALALNALGQLRLVYPAFQDLDSPENPHYQLLFSTKAKETDRTLLSRTEVKALDEALKHCLRILGPALLDSAAGKVIEWLVRRFRVNEFNIQDVLALFLPYHESPNFAKMISILNLESSSFSFLKPFKLAAKSLSRSVLVEAMRKDVDLARFVTNLLPDSFGGKTQSKSIPSVHRTLLAFNLATLLEFITRFNENCFDAATMSFLLPALLAPFKHAEDDESTVSAALKKDGVLGSFVLLSALSQRTTLTSHALTTITNSMIKATTSSQSLIECPQLLTALVSVLGRQSAAPSVSHSICEKLTTTQGFDKAILASLTWSGSEKVIRMIQPYLIETFASNENALAVIGLLLSAQNVPDAVTSSLARALLDGTQENREPNEKSIHLISQIHQRHPDIIRSCIDGIGRDDEKQKLMIEKLLLKISTPGGKASDVILAAANADPSVRCAAVRNLLEKIASKDLSEEELLFSQDSIKARLLDSHPSVVEVIYGEDATAVSLFTQDPHLLSTIFSSLASQQPSRALLRAHIQFVTTALYKTHSDWGLKIILSAVFPFALFSKPRQKTATSMWEIVCNSPLSKHGLLKGVEDIVNKASDFDTTKASLNADELADINSALVTQLAENIQASNDFFELVNWVCANSKPGTGTASIDPHVRLLCLLIGGKLIVTLTNEHQTETARKLLDAINTTGELYDFDNEGVLDLDDISFGRALHKSVVLKPNSKTTLQKSQINLISYLSLIKIPQTCATQASWFCIRSDSDKQLPYPRSLMNLLRDGYCMMNVLPSLGLIRRAIERLFEHLGSQGLLFLAGLWSQSRISENFTSAAAVTKHVALRHALAFLQAHQGTEARQDFQVIIPALICALQDSEKRVRNAALACVSVLAPSVRGPEPTEVYGLDVVYGTSSKSLQYLDSTDSLRYVQMLVDHGEHLSNDPEYLAYIHNGYLSSSKHDSKKEAKYKQRILSFLLSHVNCLPSRQASIVLLRSLKTVHNDTKLRMLEPLLRRSSKLGADILLEENNDLVSLCLSAFDHTCAGDLGKDQSSSWNVLLECIKSLYALDQCTPLWTDLLSHIRSFYDLLTIQRQYEICSTLIGLGSSSDDLQWGIKPFVRSCIKQAALITMLLKDLRPSVAAARSREAKRSKLEQTTSKDEADDVARLTFFAEVLASQQLPGSLELVSELLEVLGQVINNSATPQTDNGYTEQLLMIAIDSAASRVEELPNLSPNSIQLDALVKLMRTDNPQTFNQALLLMAALARLSSESVLRNVLPIFTFMGSNVFHRDDSYSFKVIQKATEGIVPVVMSSLKKQFTTKHDLHIGARDLLKTFTDASTHVPRHRRTNFFIHLIDVLGPAEFLAPVCMLLVDRISSKVVRQNPSDALSYLSLPLSITEHYTTADRLEAIQEILAEVRRLAAQTVDYLEKPFLETSVGDDPAEVLRTRKKRCQSLVVFVGHTLKQTSSRKLEGSQHDAMRDALATLIELSTAGQGEQASGNELAESSHWSLLNILGSIRVDEFATALLSMAQAGDKKLQKGSLQLLAERLPDITPAARERIQDKTTLITDCIGRILQSAPDASLLTSALQALRTIALTAQARDHAPLAATIPSLLQIVHGQPDNTHAISVLPALVTKLGPRMVPHLRSIVDTCVFVATSNAISVNVVECFGVLGSLVSSIPTFWGLAELKAICEMCLTDKASNPELLYHCEKLVKVVSKTAPSKLLLASLSELWPTAEYSAAPGGESRAERFFDFLKKCIHYCSKDEIQQTLRDLFKHFLQAFDLRGSVPLTNLAVEDKAIAAYIELVVKLNESSFQPLFRRSCDWAFDAGSNKSRKITFFRTFTSLLELFKEFMTPYTTFVLEPLSELLTSFGAGSLNDLLLWTACLENLSKSLFVDDGTFWNDDRVRAIYEAVVKQIPVSVELKTADGKALVTDCLLSLVACADGDPLLRAINLAVLQHSKSEEARIRLHALSCSTAMWEKSGRKLSSFGIQTATFVMECSEDNNEDVVRQCRKLRDAIELQVGKIEGL